MLANTAPGKRTRVVFLVLFCSSFDGGGHVRVGGGVEERSEQRGLAKCIDMMKWCNGPAVCWWLVVVVVLERGRRGKSVTGKGELLSLFFSFSDHLYSRPHVRVWVFFRF